MFLGSQATLWIIVRSPGGRGKGFKKDTQDLAQVQENQSIWQRGELWCVYTCIYVCIRVCLFVCICACVCTLIYAEARGQHWSPSVALHVSSTEPGTHRLSCTDTGKPLSSRDLPRPAPPVLGLQAALPHLALPNEPSPHFLSTYFLGYFS